MIPTRKKLTILNYDYSIFEVINSIKSYINKNDCTNIDIDISRLNLIDASKLAILCSAYHFTRYPNGCIHWLVANEEIKKSIQAAVLKNTVLSVVSATKPKVQHSEKKFSTSLVK